MPTPTNTPQPKATLSASRTTIEVGESTLISGDVEPADADTMWVVGEGLSMSSCPPQGTGGLRQFPPPQLRVWGCKAGSHEVSLKIRGATNTLADIEITVNPPLPPLPPAPAGLGTTDASETSISLDWDSRRGVSNYEISYGSTTKETTSSAYTVMSLTSGTSYTFNVSAYGDGSTYRAAWGPSASITATTDLRLPPAPANLEVTSASRTSIGLDWDSRNGISKYRVRYGSNSPETTSSAYTATGLTSGTSYTFNVSAYGDGSTYRAAWGPSASISATTDLRLPPAPANLEVTSASRTSIGLDWDSRNGISKYRVRYGSNSPETTSSAYTATGLTSGTSYTFNVSAYGDGSTYRAAWGPSASITATTDLRLPPAPANLEVTSASRTSIGLDWDSRNGISKYRVSYGSTTKETTSSAYPVTDLTCGTSYTFNVSAYGDGTTFKDDWGPSASTSATTDPCPPPAPANLEATSASRTSIGLDWDSRNGISKYRVSYGSNSPETTSSAYPVTGLTCGTSYTFNVSAYGDGTTYRAAWGPSASISATTDLCLPPAPANLEVTSASRTSIGLDWDSRNGISKYRVSYGSTTKETTSSAYTVTGLTRGTSYTFNVSAYGDDATYRAAWGPSASISATTDAPNRCPVFTDGTTAARRVDEDTGSNTNIGSPVSATDLDGDRLTYGKSGGDAASFTLGSSTGQLGASAALDYETKSIYEFSMTVSDGTCTDTIEVTVIVGDVDEPPSTPGAPTVTATSGSTTSLDVSWTAPANAGKPPITGYDLQYRQGTTGSFQAGPQNVAGASATISRLQMNALYEVQVRATNAEGDGPYSSSGSGRTNALPTVTIARHSSTAATVTEGQLVRFILTASIAAGSRPHGERERHRHRFLPHRHGAVPGYHPWPKHDCGAGPADG